MKSLLTIAPPTTALPRENLEAPGGFLWWYADALDEHGDGVVIIWSFGLPFLPGYAGAARRGRAARAGARPSLNIAIYQDGKPSFYSLQEFREDEVRWGDGEWEFGRTTIRTTVSGGERLLHLDVDVDVPGDASMQLRGSIQIAGPARVARADDAFRGVHDWSPLLGPSRATVRLHAGQRAYALDGRGYFDCNAGALPLHDTGIERWTWGRVPFRDRESIYYILWRKGEETPEAHGVEIDQTGELVEFSITVADQRDARALVGMRYPRRLALERDGQPWLEIRAVSVVDDGPFYVRYFIEGRSGEERAHGKGEICRTDRIDLARHRPLVRMRVEQVGASNSMWLPLFTGPREGRVGRLLKNIVGG